MIPQERFLRPSTDIATGRQVPEQIIPGENRVLSEERIMFHFSLLELTSRSP
jgi:hypothetical protein